MPHDHKSFFLFLVLVVVTAFTFYAHVDSAMYIGFIGIAWGIFGFYRFLYLMAAGDSESQVQGLSLPQILAASLVQKEKNKGKYILHTLSRFDVIACFALGLIFILWMVGQTYLPADMSVIDDFKKQQELIIGAVDMTYYDLYQTVTAVSGYGLLGLILFCSLSYGYSPTCRLRGRLVLFPLLAVLVYVVHAQGQLADPVYWPVSTEFFGRGLGASDIMARFLPDLIDKSGTPLIQRFVEGGSIAAYGLMIVFIPIVWALIKGVMRARLRCAVGLLLISLLIYLDTNYLASALTSTAVVVLLVLIGLSWGASRSDKKSLTK